MKVDLMIIGAMKTGTTSLSEILRSHPEVDFRTREMNFFSSTRNWKEDITNYERSFNKSGKKISGEASTHYAYYPEFNLGIWRDIYAYNPKMKFIYMTRHPVDRLVSQYMHMYERGYTDLSLEEAIRKEPTLINNGRYYTQLHPYIEQFGRESIFIVDFDDFMKQRSTVMNDIAGFLGIDPLGFKPFENVHANVTLGGGKWHHKYDKLKSRLNAFRHLLPRTFRNRMWDLISQRSRRAFTSKPVLEPAFKEVVINLSRLDIMALERITGRDYSHWLR